MEEVKSSEAPQRPVHSVKGLLGILAFASFLILVILTGYFFGGKIADKVSHMYRMYQLKKEMAQPVKKGKYMAELRKRADKASDIELYEALKEISEIEVSRLEAIAHFYAGYKAENTLQWHYLALIAAHPNASEAALQSVLMAALNEMRAVDYNKNCERWRGGGGRNDSSRWPALWAACAVARNSNASPEQLRLIVDVIFDRSCQRAILENPKASAELKREVEGLLKDPTRGPSTELIQAIKEGKVTDEQLMTACKHYDWEVVAQAASSTRLTPEMYDILLSAPGLPVANNLFRNPNFPEKLRTDLEKNRKKWLAQNVHNTTSSMGEKWNKLVDEMDPAVNRIGNLYNLTEQYELYEEDLRNLSKLNNPEIDKYVISHPLLTVDLLDKLSKRPDHSVREWVASSQKTSTDILKKLGGDSSPDVRKSVAENPNCPMEVIQTLQKDSDPQVREAAKLSLQRRDAAP